MLGLGEALKFFAAGGEIALQRSKLFARLMGFEHPQVGVQSLVAASFACLSLQRTDLTFYLFDDVANTQKICLGGFQLAECFALLRLVFCDSGRFLENCAAIFRTRTQDHVDLALLHHRVSGPCDSGVGKEILNVTETAGRFV